MNKATKVIDTISLILSIVELIVLIALLAETVKKKLSEPKESEE